MKKWLLLFLALTGAMPVLRARSVDDLNLAAMLRPADASLFVRDSLYYNWCNCIVRDADGMYHLFYSRWPKSIGFYAWLTHSEIAHAVAARPEGPYPMGETVFRAEPGGWDAITAHNVKVEKFGRTYYMYYIATNAGGRTLPDDTLVDVARTGYAHPLWPVLRSHQRTGVASSRSLCGPWKRGTHPLIEPHGPIKTVTVNPSVCQGPDKRYYLIVKGDDRQASRPRLIQAVGTAKRPTGPFRLQEQPAFADIPTEDVSMWYDRRRGRFYAVFHAHGGNFIGLITSEDGTHWQKARHYEVCKKEVPLASGEVMKVDRMERPFVFAEDGVPRLLSVGVKKGNDAFIVFFPLENLP